MAEYSYDDFEKLEEAQRGRWSPPNAKQKYNAKDFLLNLLNDHPYFLEEIREAARDAGLIFGGVFLDENDVKYEARNELGNLIENGIVEMRYDDKGRILYGLCKDSRK